MKNFILGDGIAIPEGLDPNDVSDGHHTFKELYLYRMMYNAALFNHWAEEELYGVHKSIRHDSGELCFNGGWFIVVAVLPTGQISNHYQMKYWNLFRIPEVEKAIFEYDRHTPEDALKRFELWLTYYTEKT